MLDAQEPPAQSAFGIIPPCFRPPSQLPLIRGGIITSASHLVSARKSQGPRDSPAASRLQRGPGRGCSHSCEADCRGDSPQSEATLTPAQGLPSSCLPCWQRLLGCHSLAQLSASCVSEQEQQARSHSKCLLEMARPGPVAAAAPFPARAMQRLRGSGFTGDMGRMTHERASQAEPGSASQAENICAPYLGRRIERSKGGLNQTHTLIPC